MFVLYTRSETHKPRRSETTHAGFHSLGSFPDYKSAVLEGQEVSGPGNFYVHTGERAPTREEQLLLPPVVRFRAKRKNMALRAAQLED